MKKKQLEQRIKELEQEVNELRQLLNQLERLKSIGFEPYIYPGSPGYMPIIPPPIDSGIATDTSQYRIFI